jgi:hypothetical protein
MLASWEERLDDFVITKPGNLTEKLKSWQSTFDPSGIGF